MEYTVPIKGKRGEAELEHWGINPGLHLFFQQVCSLFRLTAAIFSFGLRLCWGTLNLLDRYQISCIHKLVNPYFKGFKRLIKLGILKPHHCWHKQLTFTEPVKLEIFEMSLHVWRDLNCQKETLNRRTFKRPHERLQIEELLYTSNQNAVIQQLFISPTTY